MGGRFFVLVSSRLWAAKSEILVGQILNWSSSKSSISRWANLLCWWQEQDDEQSCDQISEQLLGKNERKKYMNITLAVNVKGGHRFFTIQLPECAIPPPVKDLWWSSASQGLIWPDCFILIVEVFYLAWLWLSRFNPKAEFKRRHSGRPLLRIILVDQKYIFNH